MLVDRESESDGSAEEVVAGIAPAHGRAKRHPSLRAVEPAFALATTQLADAIADELLRCADVCREDWTALANQYPDELKFVGQSEAYGSGNLFRFELVRRFLWAWISDLRWPVARTFGDGIEIAVPDEFVGPVRQASSLSTIRLFLASLDDVCCATMASGDAHCHYRLYLNVPIWIQLAVVPQFRDSFARQMRMVIHHEMGHFRWCGDALRSEQIAHARGVAALALRDWPRAGADLSQVLEKEHPEAWKSAEVRTLVLETRGGARLVRAWGERRLRMRQNTTTPVA